MAVGAGAILTVFQPLLADAALASEEIVRRILPDEAIPVIMFVLFPAALLSFLMERRKREGGRS